MVTEAVFTLHKEIYPPLCPPEGKHRESVLFAAPGRTGRRTDLSGEKKSLKLPQEGRPRPNRSKRILNREFCVESPVVIAYQNEFFGGGR